MTLIIGIDPGSKGALCLYDTKSQSVVEVYAFDKVTYSDIRNYIHADYEDEISRAFMEKPRPPAKDNSVQSARTFGEHIGYIRGLMVGMGVSLELVRDKDWQKGLVKPLLQGIERKRALKAVCQERFPSLGSLITLDTCDAILIAEWGYKNAPY